VEIVGLASMMVTAALALAELSATLLAITVIGFDGMLLGAVNTPSRVILPALADQITAVLRRLVTVAENCSFSPSITVGVSGETVTVAQDLQASTTNL
jgi:hypothetical protein